MAAPVKHVKSTASERNSCSFSNTVEKCIVVIPGQKLMETRTDMIIGNGVYEHNGALHSSLAGYAELQDLDDNKTEISVRTSTSHHLVPAVGGLVTCRIAQATPRFCKADIIAVEDNIFEIPFRGLLRREDIKATEKDKIETHKCFRPGDVVLCRVISIGDSQSYILSTAENELGVIIATSEAGAQMIPISWMQMQCPKSKAIEFRKVAKPTSEYLTKLKGSIGGGQQ
ncbi:exosome complex component CSL4-like [Watersipora subatra]|uniref:exosome complex component CSL4-like n=1 Tax=Watersipora subatra TaxID=2589382 RepID=UPI00355BEEBC